MATDMQVTIITCDGLNQLGGCLRKQEETVEMTEAEAEHRGAVKEGKYWVIKPKPRCDGWAGCPGGCNELERCLGEILDYLKNFADTDAIMGVWEHLWPDGREG